MSFLAVIYALNFHGYCCHLEDLAAESYSPSGNELLDALQYLPDGAMWDVIQAEEQIMAMVAITGLLSVALIALSLFIGVRSGRAIKAWHKWPEV